MKVGVVEKELKGLLPHSTYAKLRKKTNWDTQLIQINFYYSNQLIENNHINIHIRIRCIGKDMLLQIKLQKSQQHNFRECIEYEAVMPNIPTQLDEYTLKQVWNDYCFGNVRLVGFLVTERAIRRTENATIMLDRNAYNGKEDYEIEIESDSIEVATQIITELGLSGKIKCSRGKYERFCETRDL